MKYLIIFLLCTMAVVASDPSYTASYDIKTELNDTMLGNVIITKQSYIPEEHIIEDFNVFEVQQYDRMNWDGNETIEVQSPNNNKNIVIPGNSYIFTNKGSYSYYSIGNASKSGTFSVSEAEPLKINLKYKLGDQNTIDKGNYTINNEEIIELEHDIDDLPPGDYPLKINIKSNKNQSKVFNMTLPEIKTFDVNNSLNNNISVKAGDVENLGNLEISNTGNTNFNIKTTKSGNASNFIVMGEETMLIKGINMPMPMMAQIPLRTKEGTYQATITLYNDDDVYKQNISIKVMDNIDPEIINISFSDNYLWHNNEIRVLTEDNVGVKKAILKYNNTEEELEKDNNLFIKDVQFLDTNQYNFTFCIWDDSDNQVCQNLTKTFKKVPIVNETKNIRLPTKKNDVYGRTILFNKTEEIPINVSFIDYQDNNNNTIPTIRIVDNNDNYNYLENINDSIKLTKKSLYYLEIKSEKEIEYEGILNISVPEYAKDIGIINFKGKFNDYELPPSHFELTEYGINTTCKTEDTGDLETSKVTCPFTMPAKSVLNSVPILITREQVELYEEKMNMTIQDYQEKINQRNNFIAGIIGILVCVFIFSIYITRIYPEWRVRM